jgi:osmotically-inducible protein OsmY
VTAARLEIASPNRVGEHTMSNNRDLIERIRDAMRKDDRLSVRGEEAVLAGSVQELWQKETASTVARRFPVQIVRNDIVGTGP